MLRRNCYHAIYHVDIHETKHFSDVKLGPLGPLLTEASPDVQARILRIAKILVNVPINSWSDIEALISDHCRSLDRDGDDEFMDLCEVLEEIKLAYPQAPQEAEATD
eukprot:gene4352-4622_t